jgi:hypothetical protein
MAVKAESTGTKRRDWLLTGLLILAVGVVWIVFSG